MARRLPRRPVAPDLALEAGKSVVYVTDNLDSMLHDEQEILMIIAG